VAKKPKKSKIPKFAEVVTPTAADVREATISEVTAFAYEQKDDFVRRLEQQDFRSFANIPLSAKWLARKAAAGVDLRTMIATGNYISSIRVFRRIEAAGVAWRIGFHPMKRARDLEGNIVDILLSEVAAIQEHGSVSRNIPARPHWRPHQALIRTRSKTLPTAILREAMRRARHRIRLKIIRGAR
jgi:hypothetical protein